jgi:serine/threonine-protein kinase
MLGSGTSGAVWAAKNELIDRDVALKVMRPDVAQDPVALTRFFNEAKASGRVRSPSIVEILDLGQAEDGSPFLVFELLHGETLDERLRREGALPPEEVLELFVGVAKALDLAHAQKVIHRDLKPANIFVHGEGKERCAKILDFGISKSLAESGKNDFTLTRAGTVVGSPAYMSPEQAAGSEDLDGRADVWSLGVVLYETLTGTLPHEAPNYNALMVRILTQDCDPIMTRRVDLPPSVCAIVDGCLRRNRDERTQTAGIVAQQIEAALRELRAIRYRVHGGRRASDRTGDPFRRRASDMSPVTHERGPDSTRGQTPPKRAVLLAAIVGIALGALALIVGIVAFR